jgi:hypothetical protein
MKKLGTISSLKDDSVIDPDCVKTVPSRESALQIWRTLMIQNHSIQSISNVKNQELAWKEWILMEVNSKIAEVICHC